MTTTQQEEKTPILRREDIPPTFFRELSLALLAVLEWEGRADRCAA